MVEKSKYQKIQKNKRQTDKRATIRHAVEGWNWMVRNMLTTFVGVAKLIRMGLGIKTQKRQMVEKKRHQMVTGHESYFVRIFIVICHLIFNLN